MKKIIFIILLFILISGLLLISSSFTAQASFSSGVEKVGKGVSQFGGQTIGPAAYAASLVKALLTLVGVIFVGLIIYGGFLYMTSSGNEEKVKKGINTLKGAVIGLIIIITGYSITYFITMQLESPGAQIAYTPINYINSNSNTNAPGSVTADCIPDKDKLNWTWPEYFYERCCETRNPGTGTIGGVEQSCIDACKEAGGGNKDCTKDCWERGPCCSLRDFCQTHWKPCLCDDPNAEDCCYSNISDSPCKWNSLAGVQADCPTNVDYDDVN